MSSRDERDARSHFSERYALPSADVAIEIERRVIGATWGANGYTTLEQADELGRLVDLGPGRRLLDVGTGRGWPSLHLAQQTGCTVVGTDLPLEALAVAARRARAEAIDSRVALVAAGGPSQPFRAGSFDAVVLTDVLC
jgi:cyclopropane fatty-acyl-phospholipid synthase-like methyltransferase